MAPATAPPSAQLLYDGPDVLFTPSDGYVRYIPPVVGAALQPAYPAWPDDWGLPVDYGYQGPWYSPDAGTGMAVLRLRLGITSTVAAIASAQPV